MAIFLNLVKRCAFMTVKVAEFNWPPVKAVYVTSGQRNIVVSIQGSNPTKNCNRGGGHSGCDSRACTEAVGEGDHQCAVDTCVVVSLLVHSMICLRHNR